MKIDKILDKLITFDRESEMEILYDDLQRYFDSEQIRIIRYKVDGYRNIEIAKKLHVCPATITKRMEAIKKNLRKYIKNELK